MSPDPDTDASPLRAQHIAWMVAGASIHIASRDATHVPHLVRAVGCRFSDDRRRATIMVPATAGRRVLEDVRHNGHVAVVITQPSTHAALQLKGWDAEVLPLADGDEALVADYVRGFAEEIGRIGFSGPLARAVLGYAPGDLAAVAFSVREVFEQTPGPAAGQRLGASAAS